MSRSELTCFWQKKTRSVSFLFTQIIINLHFLVTMFALSHREPKFTCTRKSGRGCRGVLGHAHLIVPVFAGLCYTAQRMTSPLLSPDPSHSFHIVSLTHGPLLTPFKNSTAYFLLEKLQKFKIVPNATKIKTWEYRIAIGNRWETFVLIDMRQIASLQCIPVFAAQLHSIFLLLHDNNLSTT